MRASDRKQGINKRWPNLSIRNPSTCDLSNIQTHFHQYLHRWMKYIGDCAINTGGISYNMYVHI